MFFFSSRRRHTRWNCDWSSDVCSSDLPLPVESQKQLGKRLSARNHLGGAGNLGLAAMNNQLEQVKSQWRSEERRVGKECRVRGGAGRCISKRRGGHASRQAWSGR